jgi:signal transduction histidine kinase
MMLPIFYGFRLRHAMALLTSLALILVLAGYFSISAGQHASLEAVISQGRALTESLLSTAKLIIESDNAITSLAIDKQIGVVSNFDLDSSPLTPEKLESWRQALNAQKIAVVRNHIISQVTASKVAALSNDRIQDWLDSLTIDPDANIVYDFRTRGSQRYLWSYFPFSRYDGLFAAINWKYGQYGNEKLSLYYFLNQVGQESGVEYIMLQNREGIVFASKRVASMPRIADDPFLLESLSSDTTRSRMLMFQDREILETVKTFKSSEFEGIFRVGLSLYGYRQLAASVKRQVWLAVAALIIIGMLAFGLISGYQNYELLKSGFEKSHIIAQSLLDSIPGPVIAVGPDLKITDINAMAKNRLGLQSVLLQNTDYPALFPDDPFNIVPVTQSRRSANFEKSMGENKRHYYITTTPLISNKGDVMGAISIAQDITDARQLEATAESRRRLSELGALAASMAHEIRNPLNAIGITIQRMKNEIKPAGSEEEYSKFIDGLRSEIKRLNDIIEKFLAVARSTRPDITNINLNDLIREVRELFENQARSQGVQIIVDGAEGISLEGDKAGLTQVLINLIKNSLEAITAEGKIEIQLTDMTDKVKISISDNGPGISDIAMAQKPFYTTKQNGTGLGLATAAKIMADHGGELVIESAPGKGCRIDLIMLKKRI